MIFCAGREIREPAMPNPTIVVRALEFDVKTIAKVIDDRCAGEG